MVNGRYFSYTLYNKFTLMRICYFVRTINIANQKCTVIVGFIFHRITITRTIYNEISTNHICTVCRRKYHSSKYRKDIAFSNILIKENNRFRVTEIRQQFVYFVKSVFSKTF